MLSLLDGIDKPFGRINFLLNEYYSLFLPLIFFSAAVIIFQHIPVSFADAQLRSIAGIQRQFKLSGIIVNKEIRHYITFGFVGLAYNSAGFGIKPDDLLHY